MVMILIKTGNTQKKRMMLQAIIRSSKRCWGEEVKNRQKLWQRTIDGRFDSLRNELLSGMPI